MVRRFSRPPPSVTPRRRGYRGWRLPIYAVTIVAAFGYSWWQRSPRAELLVQLRADGQIQLQGQTLGVAEFQERLGVLLRERDRPVILRVGRDAPVEAVIRVNDAALAAGARDLRLETGG